MDYEKKYKEALADIQELYNSMKYMSSTDALHTTMYLEKAFPELNDSDEEIRKSIIGFLKTIASLKDGKTVRNKDFDSKALLEWAAWLEKQGEKKPTWSDENKKIIDGIIEYLECFNDYDCGDEPYEEYYERFEKYIKFMESLKPQSHWKPSDEQMDNLCRTFNGATYQVSLLRELYYDLEQLKKL